MRTLEPLIENDLAGKMVFGGGPRQVGKTTLARHLLARAEQGRYFNWDYDEDRLGLLLKRLHLLEDQEGYRCELRYLRDKEGREVDFVILVDGTVRELVEVKYGDDAVSPALRYYTERLKPERSTQIVAALRHPYDRDGIHVTSPLHYFGHE